MFVASVYSQIKLESMIIMEATSFTLTASSLVNEWILNNTRLCIATKRGLSGSPHFIWFERGRGVDTNLPLLHVAHHELDKNVDILYIGNEAKQTLAYVLLDTNDRLDIEETSGSLDRYYNSYDIA
jgi:hypothetical protein